MENKNAQLIFTWAIKNGESKIVDRILVKLMPKLISFGCALTAEDITSQDSVMVPSELFELIQKTAEELLGMKFEN